MARFLKSIIAGFLAADLATGMPENPDCPPTKTMKIWTDRIMTGVQLVQTTENVLEDCIERCADEEACILFQYSPAMVCKLFSSHTSLSAGGDIVGGKCEHEPKNVFPSYRLPLDPAVLTDCVAECPSEGCGGIDVTCKRTCKNAEFGVPECPVDQENKVVTCPKRACLNDCVAECPVMNSCGGEEITCKRTCENAEFGHSECPVNEEEKIVFCPPRACVTDCVAECPSEGCGGQDVTCKRTCKNAQFGDPECPVDQENKIVTCPKRACLTDCEAECPVVNSCGGEEITCKRTCENAEFGHSECPVNEEEKIVFCPPRACVKECEVESCSVECGIGEASCERECSMASWGDAECPEDQRMKSEPCVTDCCRCGSTPIDCPDCRSTCVSDDSKGVKMEWMCPSESDFPNLFQSRTVKKCEKLNKKKSALMCFDDSEHYKCNNGRRLPEGCRNCKKWAKGRCGGGYFDQ